MNTVFLNDEYMAMDEAKISPLDRGFLFGDGIYEVIPSYDGKFVGFKGHIDRIIHGLSMVDIRLDWNHDQWFGVCNNLIEKNGKGNLGVYLHVSRGADSKRFHSYSENIKPTVFAYAFEINAANQPDKLKTKKYTVSSVEDLRWQRCNIKSTALLGNVMHFQQGYTRGNDETILYNTKNELTEASACNVYVIKNGVVATPPLDTQILPGITRLLLLDILRNHSDIKVEERVITMTEVANADEIWLTSSSKEIAPVTHVDDQPVADAEIGDVWLAAQTLFTKHKYDY